MLSHKSLKAHLIYWYFPSSIAQHGGEPSDPEKRAEEATADSCGNTKRFFAAKWIQSENKSVCIDSYKVVVAIMNLSMISSAFSEPISPDFYYCDKFYAEPSPAKLADCQKAFNLLPIGPSLIPWSPHAHADDPHFLPYIMKHGWFMLLDAFVSRFLSL